jgi:hypothetical protein
VGLFQFIKSREPHNPPNLERYRRH